MKNKVILIGGFCEIFELCQCCGIDVFGVVDETEQCVRGTPYRYLGNDDYFVSHYSDYGHVPLVITPDAPKVRRRLVNRYHMAGFKFAGLISPDAIISPTADIASGAIIQAGVIVMAQAKIGEFVKINIRASVSHETEVQKFSTVAPTATVLGRVRIEENVYVGASSVVLPNINVGQDTIIGAGAVVIRDVIPGSTVVGVPAKGIKNAK